MAICIAGPEVLAAGEGRRLRFMRSTVRVFIHDEAGRLVGAGEVFVWHVGPGAIVALNSHGIGKAPDGPVEDEVTGQGVGAFGAAELPHSANRIDTRRIFFIIK